MSIPITDKFKPKGVGGYALMDAEDIEMPDGKRLSDWNPAYPVADGNGVPTLKPETFYQFGEVSGLEVTIADNGDGLAHEYVFSFIPADDFGELIISPNVKWMVDPQYPAGKTCVVSVCMGLAVMACG